MKKALVIGIDYYQNLRTLSGCVNDSYAVKQVLERHGDGSVNFDVRHVVSNSSSDPLNRQPLRQAISELFSGGADTELLYFAGHGHIEETGGYLLASDSADGNDGVPLSDVMSFANRSTTTNRLIILDSCFSGVAGASGGNPTVADIKEGTTILTAATANQYAMEEGGSGVFTTLFVDAMSGSAANLVGDVTPGSVYAHIDQALGAWMQRPVFKTNVKRFVSLRKVPSPIPVDDLRKLTEFFPSPGWQFQLDPSFEPERSINDGISIPPDPNNVGKFRALQRLNRVNLVVPVDAPHMWHAAIQSKSCRLTVLGEYYRKLVSDGRI